jgi:DNA-binding LacI/PurR family transcriptional regulator
MADIARMAGVSISTVSRALTGNTLIPKALREEIGEIARANGYVVNQAARSLRLRRTNTIGVVIPLGREAGQLISDPFFLEMVGRLADEITLRDYAVLLTKVASPQPGWLDRIIQSQRADGLLIIGQSNQHEALNLAARQLSAHGGVGRTAARPALLQRRRRRRRRRSPGGGASAPRPAVGGSPSWGRRTRPRRR